MQKKEKQAFLFRYKWFNRLNRLSPSQIVTLLQAMNEFAQGNDVQDKIKKMNEKTLIVWELIQEEMQEDKQAYEAKCQKLRENASLGGLARNRNNIANATKCYQMQANDSICTQIERDSDSDIKEKIYKKENSKCYNFEEICSMVQDSIKDCDVSGKFIDFLRMRASLGKNKEVTTQVTLDALIAKLRNLAKSKQEALNVLNNSIINNLTDFYPPNKEAKGRTGGLKYAN